MASTTTTTGPPSPPFTRESAIEKVRLAEDSWNTRDPGEGSSWPTRPIHDGGIARSSSTDQTKSSLFLSRKSAKGVGLPGSARNCGRSPATASRCASLTSGTTHSGH